MQLFIYYWFQHVPLQMNESCILWRNGRPLKDPLSKIEQNGTHIVNFINMEVSYSNVKWILTSKGQSNQNWYLKKKKNCICPSHRNFYFIFQWFHVIKTLVFFFETIMAVGKKMRIHQKHRKEKKKRNVMQIVWGNEYVTLKFYSFQNNQII